MRLCSAEGVLQPATCRRTQEVSQRNSGRTSCQWIYRGEGAHSGLASPKEGPAGLSPMSTVAKSFLNMTRATINNYTGTTGINCDGPRTN